MKWLKAFELEDCQEFIKECSDIITDIFDGKSTWDDLDIMIGEWKRSAEIINDEPNLMKRFLEYKDKD